MLAACDSGDGGACTLIGCGTDGLRIELVGEDGAAAPAGRYRVSAASAFAAKQCDFVLPSAGDDPECRTGASTVSWPGHAPETVTLFVTRDGSPAYTGEHTPTYSQTRPNGPGCDPVCRDGLITIVPE